MKRAGLKVKYIDSFNLEDFIENPYDYLVLFYGKEVGDYQFRKSPICRVVDEAKVLVQEENIEISYSIPSTNTLTSLLEEGYLCICNVNANTLIGQSGYAGHFILVYGFDKEKQVLYIQNPGPPPVEGSPIPVSTFEKSWAYTGENYKNILAVKNPDNNIENVVSYFTRVIESYRNIFDKNIDI